jgi:hypothetical protein
MTMALWQEVESVRSREDLARFVASLASEARTSPDSWENPTLERYLEALSAWISDMPGYFKNRHQETPTAPTWGLIAAMLLAAKVYE